jgi:hypothetical protein
MPEEQDKIRINLGYPFGQLQKALSGAGEGAAARVKQWQNVIAGLLNGTLQIGSRTPVTGTPPWVTLEVVHGGFATGKFAAAGPLEEHEIRKLQSVGPTGRATERASLNLYFLGDSGRSELSAMLANGLFRIRVPEEGALLIAAWLTDRDETERSAKLIETIMPFFDRLRFYPVPRPHPVHVGTGVAIQTVGESVRSLRAKRPQQAVARMKEAIQVWTPLYDRAVALFLQTVEGDRPALRLTASGGLAEGPTDQLIVDGGWPCRKRPPGWTDGARKLIDDYRDAREKHQLCGKPENPKENFTRLRGYLATYLDDPTTLSGRDVGMIRKILASYVTRHGYPGDTRLQETRAAQSRNAAIPSYHSLAGVLAQRLDHYPQDDGAQDLPSALGPLTAEEAGAVGAPESTRLPDTLVAKAMRCAEAPLDVLIARRVVPSSETMAALLPMVTARVRGAAIGDLPLRRVYESVYVAFRRRRSLLLLDLESQVRLTELPWISAVEPWVGSDEATREAAESTLAQTVNLVIEAFPHTLIPNKLTKELRALATGARIRLPLVDELASDIFMGAFSENFLRAAQIAGRLLRGSLYERYYGLPYDRVLRFDEIERNRSETPISPQFASLCEELARAGASEKWSVARNGTIIEQAQILTTQNLATLFVELDLAQSMSAKLPDLPRRCFIWVCRRQQMKINNWHAQMQMMKNTAYAWRQMLFYLSLLDHEAQSAFLEWSASQLKAERGEFRERFEPVMAGLWAVAGGDQFSRDGRHVASGGRRFLGWSVGRHWLLPPDADTEAARG